MKWLGNMSIEEMYQGRVKAVLADIRDEIDALDFEVLSEFYGKDGKPNYEGLAEYLINRHDPERLLEDDDSNFDTVMDWLEASPLAEWNMEWAKMHGYVRDEPDYDETYLMLYRW